MKRKLNLILLAVLAGSLFAALGAGAEEQTREIMPFVYSKSPELYCGGCHSYQERRRFNDLSITCDTYCKTCHKDMEKHHPVNVRIKEDIDSAIRLADNGKLTCISCHDLKENRYDTKPWKSQSLFGALFSFRDRYKTYYLVTRNNNGQLCKRCH